ncbi:MAG: hypothetical protein FWG18_01695 [Alphaproteobacteria bacterium]|nr:hypothetical protein [Alphaproteobacteria bacterium]
MKASIKFFKNGCGKLVCQLLIVNCSLLFAANAAKYDPTVNAAGEPKWDRFIVHDKYTDWSANGIPGGAGDDRAGYGAYNKDARFEQGRAGYGEYDPNSEFAKSEAWRKMYGEYDPSLQFEESRAWREMYGKYDPNARFEGATGVFGSGAARVISDTDKTASTPAPKQSAAAKATPVKKTSAAAPAKRPAPRVVASGTFQ